MSGGFKFDFSPSAEVEGSDCTASANSATFSNAQKNGLISDANELTAKLIERSKRNADDCTLVNASSNILPAIRDNDDTGRKTTGEEEFKPNLRFHPHAHESIDLRSTANLNLRYVIPKHTISDDTTDLIPGVYEGGLKVWECSVDLCRFLASVIDTSDADAASSMESDDEFDYALRMAVRRSLDPNGSTMELGCGHGLPGCLILRENIRRTFNQEQNVSGGGVDNGSVVIFTDFNDFVLHHATIPNAQLNVCGLRRYDGVAMDEYRSAQALVHRSVFAGGDWMGLSQKLSCGNLLLPSSTHNKTNNDGQRKVRNRVDLILAAETTYTPESCDDTAFLMLRHLKIDAGIGLVATKRFYFGVGGGTDLFKVACETLSISSQGPYSDLRLRVRTIQSFDTGNANIRDILEVTCQKK